MTVIDANKRAASFKHSGAVWGKQSSDLNCTLLTWREGEGVPAHRNDEVDVALTVIEGKGEVVIDGLVLHVSTGQVVIIPKGTERSITALSDRFTHLNVHKRRKKLMPATDGRPKHSIAS